MPRYIDMNVDDISNRSTLKNLYNLFRGTGIAGLHGILPKRDQIIRPLLFANSNEIESYITKNKS